MPLLVRLRLCRLYMYKNDHNPPHFHVRTPDGDAAVQIDGLTTLVGSVDRRAMKEATEWAEQNKALMIDLWVELQEK